MPRPRSARRRSVWPAGQRPPASRASPSGAASTPDGIEALAGRAVVVPVVEHPQTVDEAMAAGTAPLERCGERIARLVGIGSS